MININVGTYDGKLLGFSLDEQFSNNKTLYSFQSSTSLIKSVYRSGRFLFVGGSEELTKVYDVRRKIEVSLLEHGGTINQIVGHTNFLFTACDDGAAYLWKTKQWALLNKFECSSPVNTVCVHQTGKVLACGTKDKKLHLFNLMNLKRIALKKFHFTIEKIHFISKNDEIQYLLFQSDRKCYIVDCETNKVAYTIDTGSQITDSIYDDDQLILADSNGIIYLIKINGLSHKLIVKFQAHSKRVKQLQSFYLSEQPYLASISSDGEIKIWDCLLYTTDEYDEIDLQNKLKPLITIATNQRLTCLSVEIEQIQNVQESQQEEVQKDVKQIKKKKSGGVTKQIKKYIL